MNLPLKSCCWNACIAAAACDWFPKFPILDKDPKLPKLPKLARLLRALSWAAKLILDIGSLAAAAAAAACEWRDEFLDEFWDDGGGVCVLLVGGVGAGRDERDGVVSIRSILSILSILSIREFWVGAGELATGAGWGVWICGWIVTLGDGCGVAGEWIE